MPDTADAQLSLDLETAAPQEGETPTGPTDAQDEAELAAQGVAEDAPAPTAIVNTLFIAGSGGDSPALHVGYVPVGGQAKLISAPLQNPVTPASIAAILASLS